MPLTKSEFTQLKTAIIKMVGYNIAGTGQVVAQHHVLELLGLYTEESIEKINSGELTITYEDGLPPDERTDDKDR